jgi:hypothetical protein
MPQLINLNYGSGSPYQDFLPNTNSSITTIWTNSSAGYANSTDQTHLVTFGSFAGVGPTAGGSQQGYIPTGNLGTAIQNVSAAVANGSYMPAFDGAPPLPTFNSVNDITSTEEFLTNIIKVDSAQQGTPAISNVASIIIAGVAQQHLAVFNFGAVGNT